jgi:hypothetical protein
MYKVKYLHIIDVSLLQRAINEINKENGVIKFIEHEKYDMYIIYAVEGSES